MSVILPDKPVATDEIRFNILRNIIRKAMNDTKNVEWSSDSDLARTASWQWGVLDAIFQQLGGFR